MKFVPVHESDFDYLLQLRMNTMHEHLHNAGLNCDLGYHQERVRDSYYDSHLINVNDSNVGLLKFQIHSEYISVLQLQIQPELQGKGIGKQVLIKLKQDFPELEIRLNVLKQNPAKNLYTKIGFEIYGEDEHEFWMQW